MKKSLAAVFIGIIFLANGCYYDKEELLYPDALNCSTLNISFKTTIEPLIQTRCAITDCHAPSSTVVNGPGELTSYNLIKQAAVQIKSAVVSGFMPENSTLTATEKRSISCWVDAGAPNN